MRTLLIKYFFMNGSSHGKEGVNGRAIDRFDRRGRPCFFAINCASKQESVESER